ncbi:MAG: Gfo/Idh/MocA family oxidoreductase [bacterium]|nr:Gfo/Idh/MocA family oxidoreductase [bacterium]
MPDTEYRAVIVGLTGIGALRSVENPKLPVYGAMPRSHAASYYRHPQTELAAVCDLRQEALDAFYEQWKDVWPDVRLYTDYREMLEKEKPDLVSVVTPDHAHADLTVASAESGAKAILCEKPIATSLADADRMIAAAEKHGVLLSIEHSRRWAASYLQARELIRSGEIGPLRTVVCEMFSKRAMLFRNGTHLLDMICFFAEGDPAWVMAELEEGFEHFTEYQGDGGKDPATDPSVSAYIRFENGVRAFYNSSKVEFPGFQFYLTCEGGQVQISDREAKLVLGKSHVRWDVSTIPVERYMMERQLGAVGELIHVLENGGDLVSPGREARKTLELMLGMLKSHHGGNCRVDFPLRG